MKGFIRSALGGAILSTGVAISSGCAGYRDLVDPCWPERWNAVARKSVRDTFNAQAANGHALDQTIFNWHFEYDYSNRVPTDRLNQAGRDQLQYLARRQPMPDCQVFLQTANDIPYAPAAEPANVVQQRNELNNRRLDAIQRFLATLSTNANAPFQVAVVDVATPSITGRGMGGTLPTTGLRVNGAIPGYENTFRGNGFLSTSVGGGNSTSGGGGGSPGGGDPYASGGGPAPDSGGSSGGGGAGGGGGGNGGGGGGGN